MTWKRIGPHKLWYIVWTLYKIMLPMDVSWPSIEPKKMSMLCPKQRSLIRRIQTGPRHCCDSVRTFRVTILYIAVWDRAKSVQNWLWKAGAAWLEIGEADVDGCEMKQGSSGGYVFSFQMFFPCPLYLVLSFGSFTKGKAGYEIQWQGPKPGQCWRVL